jgi:hypothetical protein
MLAIFRRKKSLPPARNRAPMMKKNTDSHETGQTTPVKSTQEKIFLS